MALLCLTLNKSKGVGYHQEHLLSALEKPGERRGEREKLRRDLHPESPILCSRLSRDALFDQS